MPEVSKSYERPLTSTEVNAAQRWHRAGCPRDKSPVFGNEMMIAFSNINGDWTGLFLRCVDGAPPDPFGDAVRSAQEARPEPDPTYRPDDFTAPGFDADAAYRRAMGG